MINLNTLRQKIGAIYDELPHMPLRSDAVPTPER